MDRMSFVLPSQEDHVNACLGTWSIMHIHEFACFLLYWIYMPWIFAAIKDSHSNHKGTSNFAVTPTAAKSREAYAPPSRWQDHLLSSLLNMQRTRICVLHHRLTLKGHVLVCFIVSAFALSMCCLY